MTNTLVYLGPESAELLGELLLGKAWLVHAKALAALGQYDEALSVIDKADEVFKANPAFYYDQIKTYLLVGHILAATGKDQKALSLFMGCALHFVSNSNYLPLVDALGAAAEVLCRYKEWDTAKKVLEAAEHASDRVSHHRPTFERFVSWVEKCRVLGLFEFR